MPNPDDPVDSSSLPALRLSIQILDPRLPPQQVHALARAAVDLALQPPAAAPQPRLGTASAGNPCDTDPNCTFVTQLDTGWLVYLCNGQYTFYPPPESP